MKQHIVPRMYIGGFTDNSGLWFTLNSENTIRRQPPKEICKKTNFYELKNRDGNVVLRNTIERDVLGAVEFNSAPLLRDLSHVVSNNDSVVGYLTDSGKLEDLMAFVTVLFARSEKVITITSLLNQMKNPATWSIYEQMNLWPLISLRAINRIFTALHENYNSIFIKNKTDVPFITSSTPFASTALYIDFNAILAFPLTSNLLLLKDPLACFFDPKTMEWNATKEQVMMINELFCYDPESLIISPTEPEIRRLSKFRVQQAVGKPRLTPPSAVEPLPDYISKEALFDVIKAGLSFSIKPRTPYLDGVRTHEMQLVISALEEFKRASAVRQAPISPGPCFRKGSDVFGHN